MLVPDMAGPGGERVKLLDFGIAKLGTELFHGEAVKTRTGQVLGTASYMAPEQFQNGKVVDGQTDVYSLGVMMYRMLAGKLPFTSTNGELALAFMHTFDPPPPLQQLAPETAPWLLDLVEKMLRKDPAERPTINQVVSELQERLPFRAPSRPSFPGLTLDTSGIRRLNSLDPRVTGENQVPTLAAAGRAGGPDSDASLSSQPGSLSRVFGEASVASAAQGKRKPLRILLALGALIIAVGGILALGISGLRKPADVPPTLEPKLPANPSADTQQDAAVASTASPGAGPRTKAASSGSDEAADDASRKRHKERSGHRVRTSNRMDGKKDGTPSSEQKPQSTSIIN